MRAAEPDTNMDVLLHIGVIEDGQVLRRVGEEILSCTPLAYSGLATITVAAVAPGGPVAGDIWIDTS
jgi:hypothetical protein